MHTTYSETLLSQLRASAMLLAAGFAVVTALIIFGSDMPVFPAVGLGVIAAVLGAAVGPGVAPVLPGFSHRISRVQFGARAEFEAARLMLARADVDQVHCGYRPTGQGSDCDLAVRLRSGHWIAVEVKGTRWGRISHKQSLLVAGKPVFGDPLRQVLRTADRLERHHSWSWHPVVLMPFASGAIRTTLDGQRPVLVLGGDMARSFNLVG